MQNNGLPYYYTNAWNKQLPLLSSEISWKPGLKLYTGGWKPWIGLGDAQEIVAGCGDVLGVISNWDGRVKLPDQVPYLKQKI